MKKVKNIIIILIAILCSATKIYANNTSIQFNGKDEILPEETQVATLNIISEENIGVIQGTLSIDSGITDLEINSNYNGWLVTYNEETGKFNAFNANGIKEGEIIQIAYKLKDNATKGEIQIKDIELTTTSYNTIEVKENAIKKISKIERKSDNQNNEKDHTMASTTLPATGKSLTVEIVVIAILAVIICMIVVTYRKLKEYKQI